MLFSGVPPQLALNFKVFFITHIVLPGVLLVLIFAGLEWAGIDVWISRHFYDADNHVWPYKNHWLLQNVLHKGGRILFFVLAATILLLHIWSWRVQSTLRHYRWALLFLFLASITGPLVILILKKHTHIYCPWDLQLFNGIKPYIRFFDPIANKMPIGHCFPAAHAGSGLTFISLYFFLWVIQPKYRYWGLAFGLGLGGFYGVTQQMRGAHFLSHDLMSLLICWFASVILFLAFFTRQIRWY